MSSDTENKPTKLTYGDDYNKVEYTYDGIGRSSNRSVRFGTSDSNRTYSTAYSYLAGSHNGSTTTGLISGITQTGENFSYTYDDVGNIASVTQNSKTTYYVYDNLGQLIRVNDQNDPTSGTAGTTWVYTYDLGGNIKTKKRYDYTTGTVGTVRETVSFTYGDSNWKDKLTQYSVQVGTNPATTYTVTSDAIGNPTSDGTWSYTWEKGRQLKQMSKSGTTATFKYNSEGLRVQKTVNSTVTNYTLHGKNIVHLTQGSNTLHFWYDAQNRPAIVEWNNGTTTTKYAYIHNLQGDIVGIIDSSGNEVVKYTYDSWGKVLSTTGSLAATLGTVQPFRYRGYVYDVETGLYYLRSRYYDPYFGRFINADIIMAGNLFSYCRNQVTKKIDPLGLCSYDANLWKEDSYEVIDVSFHESVPLEAIYFLSDPLAFGYLNRYYIKRKLDGNGKLLPGKIDCSHYLYEISGQTGSYTAQYRYSEPVNCIKKGNLRDKNGNLCVELCVGMEVFRFSKERGYYSHCGKIVLHDFGDGLEFAVTESCSKFVDPKKKKALYYNDIGPNITSFFNLDGTFDWDAFVLFGEE